MEWDEYFDAFCKYKKKSLSRSIYSYTVYLYSLRKKNKGFNFSSKFTSISVIVDIISRGTIFMISWYYHW